MAKRNSDNLNISILRFRDVSKSFRRILLFLVILLCTLLSSAYLRTHFRNITIDNPAIISSSTPTQPRAEITPTQFLIGEQFIVSFIGPFPPGFTQPGYFSANDINCISAQDVKIQNTSKNVCVYGITSDLQEDMDLGYVHFLNNPDIQIRYDVSLPGWFEDANYISECVKVDGYLEYDSENKKAYFLGYYIQENINSKNSRLIGNITIDRSDICNTVKLPINLLSKNSLTIKDLYLFNPNEPIWFVGKISVIGEYSSGKAYMSINGTDSFANYYIFSSDKKILSHHVGDCILYNTEILFSDNYGYYYSEIDDGSKIRQINCTEYYRYLLKVNQEEVPN